MTIKNLRVISDPPNFDQNVISRAEQVFSQVIPRHYAFQAYYYRLLLFPNNLALVGTTDPELDRIILDLDKQLLLEKIPDDKKYLNDRYFFSNVTLCRFARQTSQDFYESVKDLSQSLEKTAYKIDSVTLVAANAVMQRIKKLGTWSLKATA
jgi:hypothetical protein